MVPTKVYQGMAAGCAVITGDTPAAGTLGTAVVRVAPGDPRALADALHHLASDKESLTVARDRAREAANQFTPESATAGLDARLAGSTGRRPALPPLTFNAHLRWDVISRELAGAEVRSVLEIGPGEGAAACRLAPGRAYTGVELSDRTRAITEARLAALGSPGRMVASVADLGEDERFDLVCAFEVIEHIDDDATALAEWAARVAPGGSLLISTPAGPDRMGAADEIAGHFRRYSAEQLADHGPRRRSGRRRGHACRVPRGLPARTWPQHSRGPAAGPADGRAHRQTRQGVVAAATEQSSSFLQPPSWSGRATALASVPGVWLQRRRPGPWHRAGAGRARAAVSEPPTDPAEPVSADGSAVPGAADAHSRIAGAYAPGSRQPVAVRDCWSAWSRCSSSWRWSVTARQCARTWPRCPGSTCSPPAWPVRWACSAPGWPGGSCCAGWAPRWRCIPR